MNCRGCGARELTEVINLGDHRLADFRPTPEPTPAYPLRLMLCEACTLLQLADLTPRDLMYHERYGFRSGVNEAIRRDLADVVANALTACNRPPSTWLDIACNDGTLLSMVPGHVIRLGCDPVRAFTPESRKHAHRVQPDYFNPRHYAKRSFDVVTAISVFYDLADPGQFVKEVESVLAPGGVWVIQQNYALDMLTSRAVDNISHEHVTYFTLGSLLPILERHGLQVVDVSRSTVNGGCFRTIVRRTGEREPTPAVADMLTAEKAVGLGDAEMWRVWQTQVEAQLRELASFVRAANAEGKRVAMYGASTRGGTLYQAAGLGHRDFCYAVERQTEKMGKWMSSLGVPIVSEEHARAEKPDYMVVSPWFFRDVFVDREADYLAAGGALVFPLPTFEVVTA